MNEPRDSSAPPLLVLRAENPMTPQQQESMAPALERIARELNAVLVVEQPGVSISLEANPKAVLDSLSDLTSRLAELTAVLSRQTAAVQDLIEAIDDGDEPEEGVCATLDGR
ncbi:MAG TPA: hypothetical protein VL027_12350 [Spongiibacteraceae bacterium]|nr:hypothetical protein [Spongiibacteraceae bacterium]